MSSASESSTSLTTGSVTAGEASNPPSSTIVATTIQRNGYSCYFVATILSVVKAQPVLDGQILGQTVPKGVRSLHSANHSDGAWRGIAICDL
jgi:hypothetical protein